MGFDLSYEAWRTVSHCALLLIMFAALAFAVLQRRIPNNLVVLALAIGLLVNVIGPQVWPQSVGQFAPAPGGFGLRNAVSGVFAGLFVFLPFYTVGAMDAGYVKLMAGIGSFAGATATVNIALFILAAGGVFLSLRVLLTWRASRAVADLSTAQGRALPGGAGGFVLGTELDDQMPYCLAMAGGLLVYGIWLNSGYPPLVSL